MLSNHQAVPVDTKLEVVSELEENKRDQWNSECKTAWYWL